MKEEYQMKETNFEESVKIAYLNNLLNRSLKLIRLGIRKLENVKNINHDDYYFVFLYLSIGLELLMKIMISIKLFENKKSFPTEKDLRDMSHNLDKLRKEIIKSYDTISEDNLKKYQMLKNDKVFISKNVVLIKLIELISEFAIGGRYFELDFVAMEQIYCI